MAYSPVTKPPRFMLIGMTAEKTLATLRNSERPEELREWVVGRVNDPGMGDYFRRAWIAYFILDRLAYGAVIDQGLVVEPEPRYTIHWGR